MLESRLQASRFCYETAKTAETAKPHTHTTPKGHMRRRRRAEGYSMLDGTFASDMSHMSVGGHSYNIHTEKIQKNEKGSKQSSDESDWFEGSDVEGEDNRRLRFKTLETSEKTETEKTNIYPMSMESSSSNVPQIKSMSMESSSSNVPQIKSMSMESSSSNVPQIKTMSMESSSSNVPQIKSMSMESSSSNVPQIKTMSMESKTIDTSQKITIDSSFTHDEHIIPEIYKKNENNNEKTEFQIEAAPDYSPSCNSFDENSDIEPSLSSPPKIPCIQSTSKSDIFKKNNLSKNNLQESPGWFEDDDSAFDIINSAEKNSEKISAEKNSEKNIAEKNNEKISAEKIASGGEEMSFLE
eukprot:GHVL01041389.1.p1 GENE.GHVL01041389.1~~GHVL01041389.1.p1  ORF type:complete len:354 (+),score=104.37 GHVL01041389.1:1705-2766(+)